MPVPTISLKHFVVLFVLANLLWFSPKVSGANTRLAVGTFGLPEKRDAELADLITARLTTTPGFELVERRELDRALKEASLSLSGLASVKDAVRVGGLLRADQFLLGTSVPIGGANRLIVRLVDARTGIIRAITVFKDAPSLDAIAQNIVDFARAEIEHPPQGKRDFLAIGVMRLLRIDGHRKRRRFIG